jgi:hypothetical protein
MHAPALQWVESNGGPLLLLPNRLLEAWEGTDEPEPYRGIEAKARWNAGGPATDYDRACDVTDLVGTVPVGAGEGLVLGDEPLATAWWPLSDPASGILVRWEYAADDAAVAGWLRRIPKQLQWKAGVRFAFNDDGLVLFDAAEPGLDPLGARLEIALSGGTYEVQSARWRPDAATSLLLHRLTSRGAVP